MPREFLVAQKIKLPVHTGSEGRVRGYFHAKRGPLGLALYRHFSSDPRRGIFPFTF